MTCRPSRPLPPATTITSERPLDVVFANYYLSAVGHAEAGADVPRCWDVLWRNRSDSDCAPIQFAVVGMNAHINHDLVALHDAEPRAAGPPARAII